MQLSNEGAVNIKMALDKENSENIKFLLVRSRDMYYGIYIEFVYNIVPMPTTQKLVRIPNSEQYCKGVISLRGNVAPVISLDVMIGEQEDECTNNNHIIILRSNDLTSVGIIASEVLEIITIKSSYIEKIADDVSTERKKICNGIFTYDNKNIFVLDINKILLLDIPYKKQWNV